MLLVTMISPACSIGDSWTTKLSMPTARRGLGAAVVDGKIYVLGGYKEGSGLLGTNEEYDPSTNTWTTKSPMPTPRESFGIAVWQNKIYVIGGGIIDGIFYKAVSVNEVYNPSNDSWETKTPMPTARWKLTAQAVNDEIYLISGVNPYTGTWLDKNEVYSPASDSWTTKAPIPTPVRSPCSVVLDYELFVLGGLSPDGNLSLNQVYDPMSNTWSYRKAMPEGVAGAASSVPSTSITKGIFVIGGDTKGSEDQRDFTNHNKVYYQDTDNWTYGTSMPTVRCFLAAATVENKTYAIGGFSGDGLMLTTNEEYTFPPSPIPEFPSFLILPLFMAATLLAVIVYRKKGMKTRQD